jgi:hypothetical protein
MIYRGPGFLAVLSHSFPPSPLSRLSLFLSLPIYRFLIREGEKGSNYTIHEKAWSSMSHSILPAFSTFQDFIGILSVHECMDWNKNITNKEIEILTINSKHFH